MPQAIVNQLEVIQVNKGDRGVALEVPRQREKRGEVFKKWPDGWAGR